jgi:hypothetical protein
MLALGIKSEEVLVGKKSYVIRYMRGIFNIRPSQPRYTFTWDVNRLLLGMSIEFWKYLENYHLLEA